VTDRGRVMGFLRDLLRIPSLPGQEGEVADRVAQEMRRLGYDTVRIDDAGNVVGRVRGRGEAPEMMLNTHLDHVDVGDPEAWEHGPFAAEVAEDRVWGRGAVDIKGPLAAQVHGVGRLAETGRSPPGDVVVTAVVQEEIGGLGARHLVEELRPALVVVGEPSGNRLRRGHRGRAELVVHVRGRSAHASAPHRGANPHYVLASFLEKLSGIELPEDPDLGRSTVAPTLVRTDQESPNVIPGEAWLTLDCRLVPGQSAADARRSLAPALEESLVDGASAEIEIPTYRRVAYTGLEVAMPAENPAYVLPADHPAVTAAADVLEAETGERPPVGVWGFATDGGHFAAAGMTVVGLGPGEEELAHTVEESVEIDQLVTATRAYGALALRWPSAVPSASG
jgi:putative selenium metabolism hydrolase